LPVFSNKTNNYAYVLLTFSEMDVSNPVNKEASIPADTNKEEQGNIHISSTNTSL